METALDVDRYKRLLLELQSQLLARINREVGDARDTGDGAVQDSGDTSVTEETRSEYLTVAEGDSSTLDMVQAALARIEAGTFGLCIVDAKPIEAKRLEALPWTPYCLKHQAELEANEPRPATL